jgi:hypothetical protein
MCGVSLGDEPDLAHPNFMNEKGYWESPSISAINDRICDYLKATYGTQFAPPDGWSNDAALEPIYTDARASVNAIFGKSTSEWAFKDPLTSFTIPFWRRVIPNLKFVVCVRNPIDVVASSAQWYLGDRNLSYAHWHVTYLTIFSEIGPSNCAMAFYEDMMADYREPLNRILDYLGRPCVVEGSDLDNQIRAFVDVGLKHHNSTIDDVRSASGIPNPVRRLYIDMANNGVGSVLNEQLAQREELMSIWRPVMEMMSVVDKFAKIEEKNLEYEQILNSRTHKIAASFCKVLIRFSEFRKSISRSSAAPPNAKAA